MQTRGIIAKGEPFQLAPPALPITAELLVNHNFPAELTASTGAWRFDQVQYVLFAADLEEGVVDRAKPGS